MQTWRDYLRVAAVLLAVGIACGLFILWDFALFSWILDAI
jgi:hypothetical protein